MQSASIEFLKEFGIETEKDLDAALKKVSFSLGIMTAAAGDIVIPFSNDRLEVLYE